MKSVSQEVFTLQGIRSSFIVLGAFRDRSNGGLALLGCSKGFKEFIELLGCSKDFKDFDNIAIKCHNLVRCKLKRFSLKKNNECYNTFHHLT